MGEINFQKIKLNQLSVEQLEKAANMLKALAHPLRIAIVNLLDENKTLTVTEIHTRLEIEQAAASHHLGILRDKGLLSCKREGINTFYFLKNEELSNVMECIGRCTAMKM
jgi:DNA-binding transcriptional ArsR family regulator